MIPSGNSFSKDIPEKSSNTFAQDRPEISANSFTRKALKKGSNAWEGDNLTSGILPGDMVISGSVPGLNESGGIGHLKRSVPEISH